MERPLWNPLPVEMTQILLAFAVVVLVDGVAFGGPLWQSVVIGVAVAVVIALLFYLAREDTPVEEQKRRMERERPEDRE